MSANGTRFHVAESGEGPLVLLLHGFPEFWWTWRAQLPALQRDGYRVVAADLRGYGGSDKPPRGFQLPVLPERRLLRRDAQRVSRMLAAWAGPGWPDPLTEQRYREAMSVPSVAHCALEYHRWFIRSRFRPDGVRYARTMRRAIQAPTLHLHGSLDTCVRPSAARGSGLHVDAPYRWRLIDGAGHFPHEEMPDRFDSELRSWLADPEPER